MGYGGARGSERRRVTRAREHASSEMRPAGQASPATGGWGAGGQNAHVRVQRVGQPDVTELRTWGAHERIAVKRAAPKRASDDATRTKGLTARRVLHARLGCDSLRRVRVGAVGPLW